MRLLVHPTVPYRPFFAWALSLTLAFGNAGAADSSRQRTRIDDGWRFALGHAWDPAQDFDHGTGAFFFGKAGYGNGPAAADFDDRPWRRVDLPHDWAVELPFSERGSTQQGSKAIGRAFPQNSVGWYRRELAIPAAAQGQRFTLEFDGSFRVGPRPLVVEYPVWWCCRPSSADYRMAGDGHR
jgi:beta-galactosidase